MNGDNHSSCITQWSSVDKDPKLVTRSGKLVPQLAFGLYKVPVGDEGEQIILNAIEAGYRHFDTATFYGNEEILGNALKKSGIPRDQFYICTKVWNDAQRGGRDMVRKSVEDSLRLIGTSFLDLVLIHWPVPQFFRDTYKELEFLHKEDKIKSIGLSNFSPQEYEQLIQGGVTVLPEINQLEISPAMYRKDCISFFQQADVLVSASKALSRGTSFGLKTIVTAAENHSVTPAQVMLRWLLQKGLICVSKTVSSSRMKENRDIFSFELNVLEMSELDNLTTNEAVKERNELENLRKTSM